MNLLIRSVVSVPVVIAVLSGCTFTLNEDTFNFNKDEETRQESVKPEEVQEKKIGPDAIKQESDPEERDEENRDEEEGNEAIMIADIDPNLDYSSEVPDCKTAAQRIADNVQVGMILADVKRVVGRPKFVFPGTWWWTEGFSVTGRPNVRFSPGGNDDVPITSFSTESSGC